MKKQKMRAACDTAGNMEMNKPQTAETDHAESGNSPPPATTPTTTQPVAVPQNQNARQPESEFGLSDPPEYPDHEFASLVAPLDEATIPALAADIKANGQKDAITLFKEAETLFVLDGRRRLRACVAAGVEPVFETFHGTRQEALSFVLSKHIRRNMSTSQRAIGAARVFMAQSAGKLSADKIAKLFTISRSTLFEAQRVLKADAAMAYDVFEDRLNLHEATEILDKREQPDAEEGKQYDEEEQHASLPDVTSEPKSEATPKPEPQPEPSTQKPRLDGPNDDKAVAGLTRRHTDASITERFTMHEKKSKPNFIKAVSNTRRVYATILDGTVEMSRVTFKDERSMPDIETFPERFVPDDLRAILAMLEKVEGGDEEAAEDEAAASADTAPRATWPCKPDTRYLCASCGEAAESPVSRWECSNDNCGETFVSSERECPSCNRPFSRKVDDYVCESCDEDVDEQVGYECGHDGCEHGGFHQVADTSPDLPDEPEQQPKESAKAFAKREKEDSKQVRSIKRVAKQAAERAAWEAAQQCCTIAGANAA